MEGTYDMPYKKILMFSWLLNQIGWGFRWEQIISSNFIILKHIRINLQFRKMIDAESPIIILFNSFFLQSVHWTDFASDASRLGSESKLIVTWI